jgi:hypothetical protein
MMAETCARIIRQMCSLPFRCAPCELYSGGVIAAAKRKALEFGPLLSLAVEIVLLDEAVTQDKHLEDLSFECCVSTGIK